MSERRAHKKQRRTKESGASGAVGGEEAGPSSGPGFKVLPLEQRGPDALPGVNKLKASLRQARRLLTRETLDPALRVSTQRRVAALEADLIAAERREVEKKNGQKYHAVKFFERQKLGRIIKRSARKASEAETDKKRAKAEKTLLEARVMLNYILNYPNSIKYIALFPAASAEDDKKGKKKKKGKEDDEDEESRGKLPKHLRASLDDADLDKPARTRLEMLLETRRLMDEGKLSAAPENERGEHRHVDIAPEGAARGTKRKAADSDDKEEAKPEADEFFDSDE